MLTTTRTTPKSAPRFSKSPAPEEQPSRSANSLRTRNPWSGFQIAVALLFSLLAGQLAADVLTQILR